MDTKSWRIFLDASALISGIISQTGASAAILDLGEAGEILIVLNKFILIETDRIFEKKFPGLIDDFRKFIKNLDPIIIADPSPQEIRAAEKVIDKDDAIILAAAKRGNVNYLVSLDTKHFHSKKAKQYFQCPIVTPAQFLMEFRKIFEKSQ